MIWKGSLQTATRHKLIKVWRSFSEDLWMISSSYLKPLSSSAAWNKKDRIFKSCRCADLTGAATRPPFLIELPPMHGLRTQPSFFAPDPSGVSRDGTRPGAKKDGCFRRLIPIQYFLGVPFGGRGGELKKMIDNVAQRIFKTTKGRRK